ncbi:unnamed protein product [Mytilus edulis]|uniref:COR domain-containing protein n=1 Tax=Mytilus edulis TaxID=6550 RepID=A0A8S3T952_MYTED|nr:unnamed protein product [Mytilus edulis]
MDSYFQRIEVESTEILASCWLWDFAGQKDFYATHQAFLSKCAVYLLVTDKLEASYVEKLWTDFDSAAEYVRFWFNSIHCYRPIDPVMSTTNFKIRRQLDPPVIVVCTNEDKVKVNTSSHKGIRENISSQAKLMNDWGKDCPLKWLLFQQVLGKLKETDVPISTTKALKKIARHKDIGITDDEEFVLCLQYYHDIGTIIYFDEETLRNYIILDPEWLVDAFRCLVSDKITDIISLSRDWKVLKERGELTGSLISLLFEKEPKLKFLENKEHLLEVMKRFDIVVNVANSDTLYMPCMMEACSFTAMQKVHG